MCRPKTRVLSAHSRASGNPEGCSAPSAEFPGSPLSRGRADNRSRALILATAAAIGLGIWLGGCTQADQYLDRRETVGLSAGDAIAANQATQVVDPWPAYSGDRNLAFNGQRMQSAVERYRTGKVTQPVDPMNLESTNEGGSGQSNQTVVNTGGGSSGSSASVSSGSGQ